MAEESKPVDLNTDREAADEAIAEQKSLLAVKVESEEDDEEDHDEEDGEATTAGDSAASASTSKKKGSKKARIKAALGAGFKDKGKGKEKDKEAVKNDLQKAVSGLSKSQVSELLSMNPALAGELGVGEGDLSGSQAAAALKKLSLQDIMTGLATSGKNVKDMASYKFWGTQPVPKFGDPREVIEEGPFKMIDPEKVPKEPAPLMDGFKWVTMDLTRDEELKEVCELLYGHYVEDGASMFRLNYSQSFLRW